MNHIDPYSHILIVNLVGVVQSRRICCGLPGRHPSPGRRPPREDIFTPPSHSSPQGIQQLRTTSWCGIVWVVIWKYQIYNYNMWKEVKYCQSMSKPFGDPTEKYGTQRGQFCQEKRAPQARGKRGNFKKIWPVEREEKLEKHFPIWGVQDGSRLNLLLSILSHMQWKVFVMPPISHF